MNLKKNTTENNNLFRIITGRKEGRNFSPLCTSRDLIFFCIVSVFSFGLIAHAYGFLNLGLSHDWLNAYIATGVEDELKLSTGRFIVPLYRWLTRGDVATPWLLGLLGLCWTAAAAVLVVELFRVRSKVCIALIAGVMVTNISYISQIASYHHEFDCNALSLLLSVAAVYFWERKRGFSSVFLGSVCILLSLGIYQAFFDVAVTLIIGLSLRDLLEKEDAKDVFLHGLSGILLLLLGGGFYLLTEKLICLLTGLEFWDRTNIFSYAQKNTLHFCLYLLKEALLFWLDKVNHPAYGSWILGAALAILSLATLLTTAQYFLKNKFGTERFLLALALLAALPFAMVCIFLGMRGARVHDLMIYSVWFFYIFLLLLSWKNAQLHPIKCTKWIRNITSVLVIWVLMQNVILSNMAYTKHSLEVQGTLSTMTRVVSDLENREDYVYAETPLAFIGIYESAEYPYEPLHVQEITGMEVDSALYTDSNDPYYNTYATYFRYVMQYQIKNCEPEAWNALVDDPRVQAMPAYPQRGYIQMVDDILVVKMS